MPTRIYGIICIWLTISCGFAYRLPKDVTPEHYKLKIITNLDDFLFKGRVTIKVNCHAPTSNITLHSQNLTIEGKPTLKQLGTKEINQKSIDISKVEHQTDDKFLVFHLNEELNKGHQYELDIRFEGVLTEELAGFYKSSYRSGNTTKWMAVTQFEPVSARRAFPCFDEPAMKATYKIFLGRKVGYTSVSNMQIKSTYAIPKLDGYEWDEYETSVPMSTYLVAFMVSDFGYGELKDKIVYKVWARKEALNQVEFSKNLGPKVLNYFEHFFGIPYPLPKLDMVAVPDFSAGAMENWGLVTYREQYLLYDPKISSTTSQYYIARIIAHELAHQWFGNLVTMKWWTDLWLNEGFATYMASLAVNDIFPKWDSLNSETAENILSVFSLDSLKTSHPVSAPIGNPSEIRERFDTISYKKGAFLIGMMTNFLGIDTFKRGISNYLNNYKYSNAEQDDLWKYLTMQAHSDDSLPKNLTIKKIMDTWTLKTGYPVLTVQRNYEKGSAEITQKRFLKDLTEAKLKRNDCWWVPLTYATQKEPLFNNTKAKAWMTCSEKEQSSEPITLDGMPDENSWIIFNNEASGLYKVNYDEKNWNLLAKALNHENHQGIPMLNRIQLIDDSFDLAFTGNLKYDVFFAIIKYLPQEHKYLSWKAAISNLNVLDRLLFQTTTYGKFKTFMRKLFTPAYKQVHGFDIKPNPDKLDSIKHQVLIVAKSCGKDVQECVTEAKDLFAKWKSNPDGENPIPNDMRGIVYCAGIKHGNESDWDFLWGRYKKSNLAAERNTILNALSCTREHWLLRRNLQWSITPNSGIRKQDSPSVFQSVCGNEVGYYIARSFFYHNIDKIYEYLGTNTERISRYITSIVSRMISEKEYEEFQNFVNVNQKYVGHVKQSIDQALENIKINIQWQQHNKETVSSILEKELKE